MLRERDRQIVLLANEFDQVQKKNSKTFFVVVVCVSLNYFFPHCWWYFFLKFSDTPDVKKNRKEGGTLIFFSSDLFPQISSKKKAFLSSLSCSIRINQWKVFVVCACVCVWDGGSGMRRKVIRGGGHTLERHLIPLPLWKKGLNLALNSFLLVITAATPTFSFFWGIIQVFSVFFRLWRTLFFLRPPPLSLFLASLWCVGKEAISHFLPVSLLSFPLFFCRRKFFLGGNAMRTPRKKVRWRFFSLGCCETTSPPPSPLSFLKLMQNLKKKRVFFFSAKYKKTP